ncbi:MULTISPECIES: hypothetical protein [Vibrio]|uniref:Uncharacterized protein n=1 Tax=Vibrio proteolyticus NBRC 13287 TaxID=1219065 RepID=U3A0P3_VIBPR|nr:MULTISPECIES: hypothetical protein [Vibrio]NAW60220.1 hypothetical protein [Vibrio sp. V36_P2S2PM302]NAX23265.1 hypothetical protein [Vibrio sp. V39_P1S14PM300]NAX27251.1 hypothetical protein [Vibrio sp. V38_P2S17PM301]NAX29880.1 hypothetical protein [Vibrio sp. V37_P2S8PM304]GAD67260.1 hypothetical protein VPR01S_07_00590 [Vibrio proteolyticus NBRC 13287]
MLTSEIIVPKSEKNPTPANKSRKLSDAYKTERTRQEVTEIELNRATIVIVDEDGQLRKVPLLGEH